MAFATSMIRIALVVAFLNATARVGLAYWAFYQLRDDAQQTALFGSRQPTAALQGAVLDKADELLLPVDQNHVTVTRNGAKTIIEASYVHPIEYFPNQTYPMEFSFSVEALDVVADTIR